MGNELLKTQAPAVSPKGVLIFYLAHFIVPLIFVVDVLAAWRIGAAGTSAKAILAVCAAWLVLGLGALLAARDRARFLRKLSKPLMAVYACYICLAFLEILTRVTSGRMTPALYTPGTSLTLEPDVNVMPGVSGISRFTVNGDGLRGPSVPKDGNVFKIVTVGGSTTECLYLDDAEEWPRLSMEEMNSLQKRRPVWVANAGVSGHTTAHHLMLLRTLPTLGEADMIIFLIGINDLQASLALEGASTESYLANEAASLRDMILAGGEYPYPRFKRLKLYKLGVKAAAALASKFNPSKAEQTKTGAEYAEWRRKRAAGKAVSPPDLGAGIEEFRDRVLKIAHECQARGVRCLFVTQPAMWRDRLTPAEEGLLWFGFVGNWEDPKGYLTAADAAQAIDLYNRSLLNLCREDGLECLDLASLVPKDTSAFYDDCHFNEGGARMVARVISNYVLSTPPFNDGAPRLGAGGSNAE